MYKGLYFVIAMVLAAQGAWASSAQQQFAQNKDLKSIMKEFSYLADYVLSAEKRLTKAREACQRFEVKFTTDYPNNPNPPIEVDSILYIPKENKGVPAELPFVVQLPPMGGVNVLDKWMGHAFCSRNIAVLIIKNDFTGFDDKTAPPVEDHDHAFKRTAASVKAALRYAHDHPRLDSEKTGLFGVSLGGILGSFIYGIEDRMSVGHFIVAGSDTPHIVAHSQEKRVSKLRRLRMQEQGFSTNDEYEEWLRDNMFYDNSITAVRVPPETVKMVISENDKNVPTPKQMELQQQMGTPETTYKTSSHAGTVINTLIWRANREKIADFYNERFALENPRLDEAI